MIGSHNSFTYLQPVNPIFRLFTRLWRCQCKTITEQYGQGVRFFDIRVVNHHGKWYMAHGLVRLKCSFLILDDICYYMARVCPDAIYRIVLERGSMTDELLFLRDSNGLYKTFPNLWRIDIKTSKSWLGQYGNNNQALYDKGYKFAKVNTWESPAQELHGKVTKDNWYKVSLKKEAKKINKALPYFNDNAEFENIQAMHESKEELYFIDYCTNEY